MILPSTDALTPSWSAAAAAVLLLSAASVALAPLWRALHSQWTDVALYQHGYVVAGMAAWLGWHSLKRAMPVAVGPSWGYLVPLIAVVSGLALLEVLYLNVPRLFLLPLLLVAVTGLVFGNTVATRLFWPAALIYGALPVWSLLNGSLRSLTTAVVSRALLASDIPVLIDGNFVSLPAGVFEIAEGCSGLKYVVVASTLAVFYAFAFLTDASRRFLLLAGAVSMAVVCNWVRVYVIILAGHLTDMQHYLVAEDHIVFGWMMFVIFLFPVLWLARAPAAPVSDRRDSAPVPKPRTRCQGPIAAAALASVLMTLPRLAGVAVGSVEPVRQAPSEIDIGLPLELHVSSAWRPVFINAEESYGVVRIEGEPVEVYRAVYPRQDDEHKLIAFHNDFVPPEWRALNSRRLTVRLDEAEAFAVIELEGELERRRRVVWGWYWVAGAPATRAIEAKALELKGLLSGRRDAVAMAVSAECDLDCGGARKRLAQFMRTSAGHSAWAR